MIKIQIIAITLTFLLKFSLISNAQENKSSVPNPTFDKFTGTVYSMPIMSQKLGKMTRKTIRQHYSEDIYDYNKIGVIELEEINVPETIIGEGEFPGVDRSSQFCMILESKMKIELDACYEFSLNSDDGSILWINGVEVVNNDGGHQMQLKKDSVSLNKGAYDVRIWYFQGLPDRFGLIFNSKIVGKKEVCREAEEKSEIEISTDLLFATGKYQLTDKAIKKLEGFVRNNSNKEIKTIEVIGHTDNVGSEKSNMTLSQKRSDAIAKALRTIISDPNVTINSIGKGETEPKTTNDTKEGRGMNRRVQIIIY